MFLVLFSNKILSLFPARGIRFSVSINYFKCRYTLVEVTIIKLIISHANEACDFCIASTKGAIKWKHVEAEGILQ